jgi:hypothetical protein
VLDSYIPLVPVPVLAAVVVVVEAEDFDTPFALVLIAMEVVFHVVVEEEGEEGEGERTAVFALVEIHIDLVVAHNLVDFEVLRILVDLKGVRIPVNFEEAHSLDSAVVRIHVNCNSEEPCMPEDSVAFQNVVMVNINRSVVVVV